MPAFVACGPVLLALGNCVPVLLALGDCCPVMLDLDLVLLDLALDLGFILDSSRVSSGIGGGHLLLLDPLNEEATFVKILSTKF